MIELDCGNLGGVDEGGKRGAGAKKQMIIVAIEFTHGMNKHGQEVDYPARACVKLAKSENGKEIFEFVKQHIEETSIIKSDGSNAINVLNQKIKDVDGNVVKKRNGEDVKRYNYELDNAKFDEETNPLDLVHTFISNLKALIHGIYHGLSIPYMDLFVEEYVWRFNHRTMDNNRAKLKLLVQAIFRTPVRTAKDFKEYYSNILS